MSREEQEHGPAPSPASSHEHPAYLRAARFGGEKPAARAYRQAQDLLFATPDCELSAFRFHLDRLRPGQSCGYTYLHYRCQSTALALTDGFFPEQRGLDRLSK